jgi:hypothetical protein
VEGSGLVLGAIQVDDLGQATRADDRLVLFGDEGLAGLEKMLIHAVMQDAFGLPDIIDVMAARVD